jgi:hypothetical protein
MSGEGLFPPTWNRAVAGADVACNSALDGHLAAVL